MVECDECPVCYHPCNALTALEICPNDEIFYCSCVHQDDIGEGQDARKDRGSKEGSVLDNDEVSLVFVWDAELPQEPVGWLTDNLVAVLAYQFPLTLYTEMSPTIGVMS